MKNNYEYYRTNEDALEEDKTKEILVDDKTKEELEKIFRNLAPNVFSNNFNDNFIYFTDK